MAKRKRPENWERYLTIRSEADVDRYSERLKAAAARAIGWLCGQQGDPLDLLRRMKFAEIAFHPIEDRPLNLIEQVNQTWTYAAALAAARELLRLHPRAGGFKVAPGAHMAIPLDIMSFDGMVGAETFAAVNPRNNGKLTKDVAKMAQRHERHRYVFFSSPQFPALQRLPDFEKGGVQVWSVEA